MLSPFLWKMRHFIFYENTEASVEFAGAYVLRTGKRELYRKFLPR